MMNTRMETIDRLMDALIVAARTGTPGEVSDARSDLGRFMMNHSAEYTKDRVIAAFVAGADWGNQPVSWNERHEHSYDAGVRYVSQPSPDFALDTSAPDAPRIAPEASGIEQPRSTYLPPDGTPEEVLAKVLASLLCRTAMMFFDEETKQFPALFSIARQEAMLDALRTAYPILGAVEDARVEERV